VVGVRKLMVGFVWSSVTVMLLAALRPAASKAWTMMLLVPADRGMDADQPVVPVAVLLAPPLLDQVTDETTKLSPAVPLRSSGASRWCEVRAAVLVIATVGLVASRMIVVTAVAELPAWSVRADGHRCGSCRPSARRGNRP